MEIRKKIQFGGGKWVLILMALAISSAATASQKFTGRVVKLSDGDTLQFQVDGAKMVFKVRMMGIDTAETHLVIPGGGTATQGYWGDMGSKQLERFVSVGDQAVLEVFGEDHYGRKLGRIFKNGEDVNFKMIRSGWGSLFVLCESGVACKTGSLSPQDLLNYRRGCVEAYRNGRGLFDPRHPVPEMPFVFRARETGQPLTKFVADLSNGTYVKPNKFAAVQVCNRLFYFTESDAIRNGFKPAQ